LAISYGIVERHGGSIEIPTQPGRGTTFIVKLPVQGVEPESSRIFEYATQ
jgi:two-component system NtrC family sensor kinase